MVLKPGTEDQGIIFVRTDLPGSPSVRAELASIVRHPRRTALKRGEAEVHTVEHLMAAAAGLGVDNLTVELDAAELPAGDGSARPLAETILAAGVIDLDARRRCLTVSEGVFVSKGEASLIVMPQADGHLIITYNLDYEGDDAPTQSHTFMHTSPEDFLENLAPARTFLPLAEAEALRRQGIGKGANYKNTLVIGPNGVIENELRFPNEFARHKVLDILGDMALVNVRLRAHIVGVRSGHANNWDLASKLANTMKRKLRAAAQDIVLDTREIARILPHRYPLLMIDRVIELEGDRRAVGIKNVTINEEFFRGHFPGRPIMPGVLQIEAMAQLSGVLLLKNVENVNKIPVMLSLNRVKLRRPVFPGDQMRIESEVVHVRSRTAQVSARATVAGRLVSEAQISFMLVDADEDDRLADTGG